MRLAFRASGAKILCRRRGRKDTEASFRVGVRAHESRGVGSRHSNLEVPFQDYIQWRSRDAAGDKAQRLGDPSSERGGGGGDSRSRTAFMAATIRPRLMSLTMRPIP